MNNTSDDEFSAVSIESWMTPMINPMVMSCIAMKSLTPRSEHANGIRSNEPPFTPDAPHAANVETIHSNNATEIGTSMPNVNAAARDMTVIVIAAPSMLIVAPNGIETE